MKTNYLKYIVSYFLILNLNTNHGKLHQPSRFKTYPLNPYSRNSHRTLYYNKKFAHTFKSVSGQVLRPDFLPSLLQCQRTIIRSILAVFLSQPDPPTTTLLTLSSLFVRPTRPCMITPVAAHVGFTYFLIYFFQIRVAIKNMDNISFTKLIQFA